MKTDFIELLTAGTLERASAIHTSRHPQSMSWVSLFLKGFLLETKLNDGQWYRLWSLGEVTYSTKNGQCIRLAKGQV